MCVISLYIVKVTPLRDTDSSKPHYSQDMEHNQILETQHGTQPI